MSDLVWWPNWYVTRLHLVVGARADVDEAKAICGAFASNPSGWRMAKPWQEKRRKKDTPRCAHCLRKSGAPTEAR